MSTKPDAAALSAVPTNIIRRYEPDTPVAALREYPGNPRDGDVGAISESFAANNVYDAIVVQESTGYVLAGNHRLRAAQALGMDTLPVLYVDVDDAHARRIVLADNRTSDRANYQYDELLALLTVHTEDGGDLFGTGYDQDDFDLVRAKAEGTWGDDISTPFANATAQEAQAGTTKITITCPDAQATEVRTAVTQALVDFADAKIV